MKTFWFRVLFVIFAIVMFDRVILPFYTSSGREISVPDVRNMSFEDAARKLKWSGLEAKKSYNVRYLSDVGPDIVLDQLPAAMSSVKPGRNVYLVLNRQEKPSYSMPELVGRPENEARQALARIGMTVDDVQFQSVSNVEEDGRVLSQTVPANVSVKIGTGVALIVGKLSVEPEGMKRMVVPEVLGMSIEQARSVILQRGLTVGKITYEYSAMLVPNTVISQKPAVNTFLPAGQQVEMTVVTKEH
ncbi:MAG: PASTA domain-containing protein [Chlorobiaceae bacterium]|nr:PASTA domain-containing protein [Chlorobiaceae bacterium]